MASFHFTTPLSEADVRQLAVGDCVTLDGVVFGIRDASLMRLFDKGAPCPVDLRGSALLHTAPNVRKLPDGRYEALCIGTTTSMRMDRFTEALLRDHGVRAILGKGGLSAKSAELMSKYGAVYLSVTGGAAAGQTLQTEAIEQVFWEDLMPECLWQFRVKGMGPLTVGIDARGQNLQLDVQREAELRSREILRKMGVT